MAPGDRGNKQSGKSTPQKSKPLGILIPAFFWRDALRSAWRGAARASGGVGGHRHAATKGRCAGTKSRQS